MLRPPPLAAHLGFRLRAAALGVLAACGDADKDLPTAGSRTIAIELSATSLTVAQGESRTATLTLTRSANYSGAVTLTAEDVPTGVVVSVAPDNLTGATSTTSTVSVVASGEAAVGSYPVTLRASGGGVGDKTVQLTVEVTAAVGPAYALVLSPASLTVAQGGRDSTRVGIVRAGGFAGPVTLAVTGLPEGVTASVSTGGIAGDTSTILLTVGGAVPLGVYSAVVTASSEALTERTTALSLTVTAAVDGSFGLAVVPAMVTVQAGGAAATATLTVTRVGPFTGPVALTLSGSPSGLTVTATPPTVPSGSTTATIAVQASAALAPGSYDVAIAASGAGVAAQNATLRVTVTAAPGGGTLTLAHCADDVPVWLAAQNGVGGAWTRIAVGATGTSIPFPAGRGGVAMVREEAGRFELNMMYAGLEELQQASASAGALGCGRKAVSGSVAGVAPHQVATVSLGTASADFSAAVPTDFTLADVPDGERELVATRLNASLVADRVIIRRGVDAAAGSVLPVLDFDAAEAFAPLAAQLTVSGIGTDLGSVLVALRTAGGSTGSLTSATGVTDGPTAFVGVPPVQLGVSDIQEATVLAQEMNGAGARLAGIYFRGVSNRALLLGPPLGAITVTSIATAPYRRLRATFAVQQPYNRYATAVFAQENGNSAYVSMTAQYRDNATTWTLDVPDLSGVDGFDVAWGLGPAVPVAHSVTAAGGYNTLVVSGTPPDGATFRPVRLARGRVRRPARQALPPEHGNQHRRPPPPDGGALGDARPLVQRRGRAARGRLLETGGRPRVVRRRE